MVRRVATILAALALSLAAPAAALAQGAGDDQYTDPFGNGQAGDNNADDSAQEPEPTPEASSAPEESAPAPAPTATAAAQGPAAAPAQLPRTGGDAGLLALAGTVLVTGGVVLRRRVS